MARFTIIPDETKIDFVRNRFTAFAIDGLLVVITIASLMVQGLNLGIDFTGGVIIEAKSTTPINFEEARHKIEGLGFKDPTVQQFGDDKSLLIRIKPTAQVEGHEQAAAKKIQEVLGSGFSFQRVEAVGPKVSAELAEQGIIAVVSAIIGILLYVWFRFEWQFAAGAVLSLLHDVLITIGIFCLLRIEFNLQIIAAILTIVGYSLNDTVVVFDRIRENIRINPTMNMYDLIDHAITQTLSRTIVSSLTVILSMAAVYIFTEGAIQDFALALIIGVVVGTYSSIFVAAPLMVAIAGGKPPKEKEKVVVTDLTAEV